MVLKRKRTLPHLHAKRELMLHALELTGADGMLASERRLCEMIGVSRSTLRKALAELINEAFVINIPCKGNFITGGAPHLQIGIVVSGWNIPYPKIVAGAMDALSDIPCWLSVIHIKGIEELESLVENYALAGALLVNPRSETVASINKRMERLEVPVVSAIPFVGEDADVPKPDHAYVCMDKDAKGRLSAEFALSRGHRKIAYAGNAGKSYAAFKQTLATHGVEHHAGLLCEDRRPDAIGRIGELLDSHAMTAIVSDGGPLKLERLFGSIASHPYGASVELEVPKTGELPGLQRRFQNVRVAGMTHIPYREIGEAAAKMLVRSIEGKGLQAHEEISPFIMPQESA